MRRVAITPVFPFHNPTLRARLHLFAFTLQTFGRSRRIVLAIADTMAKSPDMSDYTAAERAHAALAASIA